MNKKKRILIQSISSDLGYELAKYWLKKGHEIYGTYRTDSSKVRDLKKIGIDLNYCDLLDNESINNCTEWIKLKECWDVVLMGAGLQNPIGLFEDINFDEWEKSLVQNFTGQIRLIHNLLPFRNRMNKAIPVVLMFAGGGTNNATVRYSAYTISKIALIKMCELLDAEIKDTIFTILGPGWVKTKIHQSTLDHPNESGANYQKTKEMLEKNKCYPIEKVLECCDWIINSSRELVSGRNFSAVHDPWESKKIINVMENENNFKLRRFGNNLFLSSQ